jgi:hypothetical protein
MGDAMLLNMMMSGNDVGYSSTDDGDDDDDLVSPRSGTISPAWKLFMRVICSLTEFRIDFSHEEGSYTPPFLNIWQH